LRALKGIRDATQVEIAGTFHFDPTTKKLDRWTIDNPGTHAQKVKLPDHCRYCFHTHPDNPWNYPSPPSGSDLILAAMRHGTVHFVIGNYGVWIYAFKPDTARSNVMFDTYLKPPVETPRTLDLFLADCMKSHQGRAELYLECVRALGFAMRFVPYPDSPDSPDSPDQNKRE